MCASHTPPGGVGGTRSTAQRSADFGYVHLHVEVVLEPRSAEERPQTIVDPVWSTARAVFFCEICPHVALLQDAPGVL